MKTLNIHFFSLTKLFCITIVFCLIPVAQASPTINQPAPDFTATDAKGKSHRLADYSGKLVVLEWTNHQCPFTVKHYKSGNMQSLQQRYTDKGVVWLSVVSSAKGKQGYVTGDEALALTQSRNAQPTAVLLDESGTLGKLYDAKTTPHMYIIDKEGKLAYNGAIDSIRSADPADIKTAENYLSAALDALMAGNTVSKALTKPYGCSVKY